MIDQNIIDKLRERYIHVDPLMFHRSVERAKSPGDLFDILEGIPDKFPIIWCETSHCWVVTDDMCQSENFTASVHRDEED